MFVGSCEVHFRAPWVTSLKEKRMVLQSLLQKTRHKFNVSIAEISHQDVHQTIALGFACVSNEAKHAEQMVQTILQFMENHTDAELVFAEFEVF